MFFLRGDILELRRGEFVAGEENSLFLKGSKNSFELKLPHYRMPEGKHSAGYYAAPGMSAIDLFIGSEGTLGVITEVEVGLIPKPQGFFSGIVFFDREENAWQFANRVRDESLQSRAAKTKDQIAASAVEYFDNHALEILRSS